MKIPRNHHPKQLVKHQPLITMKNESWKTPMNQIQRKSPWKTNHTLHHEKSPWKNPPIKNPPINHHEKHHTLPWITMKNHHISPMKINSAQSVPSPRPHAAASTSHPSRCPSPRPPPAGCSPPAVEPWRSWVPRNGSRTGEIWWVLWWFFMVDSGFYDGLEWSYRV